MGLNLHNLANKGLSKVFGTMTYTYRKYNGRTINDLGNYVSTYEPDIVRTTARIYEITTKELEDNGLDTKVKHIKIYDSNYFTTLDRGQGADQCLFNGELYELLPEEWNTTNNGWSITIWAKQ